MNDLDNPVATKSGTARPTQVVVAGLLAATAVVAIALVDTRNDNTAPAEQPAPTITVTSTTRPRAVLNPVAEIRSRLVDQGNVELFRVKADGAAYWRLTTLPEFDGRTFELPESALMPLDDGTGVGGRRIRQQIEILGLEGQLLPAAADPRQVAPDAEIRINRDTSTLVKTNPLLPGDTYTIVSVTPEGVARGAARGVDRESPGRGVRCSARQSPGVVSELAAEVTAGATTDFDRLVALQDWFRTSFECSTEVQPGHGSNAIERFLQVRDGYCEQFAAAFAMMARTLGIPSRVAVGYTPGQLWSDGWYSVFGRNSHALPEVWFGGQRPTPPRSRTIPTPKGSPMTLDLDRSVRAVIHDLIGAAPPISDSPTRTITTETGSARPSRRGLVAVAAAAIALAGIGGVLALGAERTPSQPRDASPGVQTGPTPTGSAPPAPTGTAPPQAATNCATRPKVVTLPNLAGESYADAAATLRELGVQPAPLFENTPRGVATATDPVVNQRMLPGVIVSCGTQVELVVAFDPGPLHIVQPGETFASIASATGITVDDLIAYNGFENDAELRPGLAIRLSAPDGPPTAT